MKQGFPFVSFLLEQEQLGRKRGVINEWYLRSFPFTVPKRTEPKRREYSKIDLKLIKRPTPHKNKLVF